MNKARFRHNKYSRKCSGTLPLTAEHAKFLIFILFSATSALSAVNGGLRQPRGHIENAIIVTQLPPAPNQQSGKTLEREGSAVNWFLKFGEGARLVKVNPDSSIEELSRDFHSACDPAISFDASHILFAGKKTPDDDWNIYEMDIDGSNVRQITNGIGDCRSPCYQPALYTIAPPKAKDQTTTVDSQEVTESWADMISIRRQVTFISSEKGVLNEAGVMSATSLYSCQFDGTALWRLTFNLSGDMDPLIMQDGRLLFASRQRVGLNRGLDGRIALCSINTDGTDYAMFYTDQGRRIKRMPCTTTKGLAVFIESDEFRWDGAGGIGCTLLRRPLHSYRPITEESDGLFHSPSALADGRILVSRKSSDNTDTYGVFCLDPSSGHLEMVFDSPEYHDVQAKAICPCPEPDAHSSVVTEKDPNGKLYCLDVYISDIDKPEWMSRGTVKRLRVLEGFPDIHASSGSHGETTPVVQRRILGEIDIEQDGSFNIEIPANTPIELQTLDADGIALRSCGWIWARNHEPRGCIGCHEDGELTPENVLVEAVKRPSIKLNLPVKQRRTVDFRHDVIPIISKKCIQCHSKAGSVFCLADGSSEDADEETSYKTFLTAGSRSGHGKYVNPGRARTSLLIWRIFGRNMSRPWDDTFSRQEVPPMPPAAGQALSTDEKRTFTEWIDMGAIWESIPGPDELRKSNRNNEGSIQ